MHLLLFYYYKYTFNFFSYIINYGRTIWTTFFLNMINFYFNIFILYTINNILISYDCMYVKHLRAILIDWMQFKYFYYYYYLL